MMPVHQFFGMNIVYVEVARLIYRDHQKAFLNLAELYLIDITIMILKANYLVKIALEQFFKVKHLDFSWLAGNGNVLLPLVHSDAVYPSLERLADEAAIQRLYSSIREALQ